MATLCAETNAILELDLGSEHGMRHISLTDLWDQATSRASYQCLSEMVLAYTHASTSEFHRVTVTYTDEDENIITISTDDELMSAFEQFSTRFPLVVSAKAYVQVENDSTKIVKQIKQALSEIGGTLKEGKGDNNQTKADQMQGGMESFLTTMTETVHDLSTHIFPLSIFAERDRHLQKKRQHRQSIHNKELNRYYARRFEVCSADSTLKEIIRWSLQYINLNCKERKAMKEDKTYIESHKQDDGDEAIVFGGRDNEKKVHIIKDEGGVKTQTILEHNCEDKEIFLSVIEEKSIVECSKSVNVGKNEDASFSEAILDKINEQESLDQLKLKETLALARVPLSPKAGKTNNSRSSEDCGRGQGRITDDIDMVYDATTNVIGLLTSKPENELCNTTLEAQTPTQCTNLELANTANSNNKSEESCPTQISVGINDEWQLLIEDSQDTYDSPIAEDDLHLEYTLCQSDTTSDKMEFSSLLSSSFSSHSSSFLVGLPSLINHTSSSNTLDSWSLESMSATDMMSTPK